MFGRKKYSKVEAMIAKKEGVSAKSVHNEMQKAITKGWEDSKSNPEAKAFWIEVMGYFPETPPEPTEFIKKMADYTKKKNLS